MLGGDVFEGVGFVEDDNVVFGQVIDAGHSQGEVGEEQRVVDDQDVAAVHSAFGGLPEAGFVELAFFPEAVAVLGADAFPDAGGGDLGQVGERAIGGLGGPLLDGAKGFELVGAIEKHALTSAGLLEAALAEIVAAAFDQDGAEFVGKYRANQWDVLFDQLLLQGDGVGRDDDAFALADGIFDCGQEVGEGFADAGSGFDEEVVAGGEGIINGGGHGELLGAGFVEAAEPPGDGAIGAEDGGEIEGHVWEILSLGGGLAESLASKKLSS